LLKIYGPDLLCVRYRYDHESGEKCKTVELIIDRGEMKKGRIHGNKKVNLKIEYTEINYRRAIKKAGGKWNKDKKVWQLPFRNVVTLNLTHRIIADEGQ